MAATHIRNPLTIIGIFAAVAEVSGTGVAPFLPAAQQEIFVWFLMFFPTLLVIFFFLTLNFNPKVLYAPSDFADEENFLKIHKYDPSTQKEFSEQIPISTQTIHTKKRIKEISAEMAATAKPLIVSISNFVKGNEFMQRLKAKGYSAEIYQNSSELTEPLTHESIWVGKRVPASSAVDLIKEAKHFFPHLKYLHISGDTGNDPPDFIHDQIYVGGSTDTAVNIYKIRPFSDGEIDSLSESVTQEELHSFIRKHYQ